MYRLGQLAQVGGDGHDLAVRRGDPVPAAGHVVGGGKRGDRKLPDLFRPAPHRDQLGRRGQIAPVCQKIQGFRQTEHRHIVVFQEHLEPGDMVGVLMGDEDALQIPHRQAQILERAGGDTAAFAHIDKQIALAAAHQAAVAGGTGIQGSKTGHFSPHTQKTGDAHRAPGQRLDYSACGMEGAGTDTRRTLAPRPCSLPTRFS